MKFFSIQVFGAYCSTRWYERNVKDDRGNRQAYFGTGETFLFSLYPERAKYPWVGMEQSPGEKQLDHSAELFLAADHKMITIGGGYASVFSFIDLSLYCVATDVYFILFSFTTGKDKRFGWTKTFVMVRLIVVSPSTIRLCVPVVTLRYVSWRFMGLQGRK